MSPRDLYTAVSYQNRSAVEKIVYKLLSKGPLGAKSRKLFYRDEHGLTCLHKAAITGQFEVLQLLLNFNLDLNLSDDTGHTALHYAAYSGNESAVYLLLTCGSNINAQDSEGQTALHVAARDGHAPVCGVLLKRGAHLGMVDKSGKTALDTAAEFGKYQVLKICLQNPESKAILNGSGTHVAVGAKKSSIVSDVDDFNGHSPLQLAVLNGHMDCIRLLIQFGCDVNKEHASGTALHAAALCGKLKIVQLLVQNGADVFKKNSAGETALDKLNKYVSRGGCADVKGYLLACMNSLKAKAIQTYDAVPNSSHLKFNAGDILTIVERSPSGLWKGSLNNKTGLFPKEYVEILPKSYNYTEMKDPETSRDMYSETFENVDSNYVTVDVNSFDEEQRRFSSDWVKEHFGEGKSDSLSLDFERFKMPLRNTSRELESKDSNALPQSSYNVTSNYPSNCELLNEEAHRIILSLSHSSFSAVNEIQILERLFTDPNLKKFAKLFIDNGYDSYTAVKMSSADLAAVGVSNPGQRQRLVEVFQRQGHRVATPTHFLQVPQSVNQFMDAIHLNQYTALLMKSEYSSLAELAKATSEDLMEIGIEKLGHQKRILIYLKMLNSLVKLESGTGNDLSSLKVDEELDKLAENDGYTNIEELNSPSFECSELDDFIQMGRQVLAERQISHIKQSSESDSGTFTLEDDRSNSPDTINGSTETLKSCEQQSRPIINKIPQVIIDSESMRNSPDMLQNISVHPGHSLRRNQRVPPQNGVLLSIDPVTKLPVPRLPSRGTSPGRDNALFTQRHDSFVPPSLPALRNSSQSAFTASRNTEIPTSTPWILNPGPEGPRQTGQDPIKGTGFSRTESVASLESEDPYLLNLTPPTPPRLKTPSSDTAFIQLMGNNSDLNSFNLFQKQQFNQ